MSKVVWGVPGKASVLVGGCWGSEGKGAAAAWLSQYVHSDTGIATTNAGAQAGHTTQFRSGRKFICYHLPTTGVMRSNWVSYINAGSIIDPGVLEQEIADCGVNPANVYVHPHAAVITDVHKQAEKHGESTQRIASTQKGVGAAIADKIMRRSLLAKGTPELSPMITNINLNHFLADNKPVVVEVPQGLELSINHGCEYPYTTSRDCYVNSGLSDAGIHPSFLGPVAMAVRTFPIRVGNLINEEGQEIGQSGPFYPDQEELSWDKDFPGIVPERTTVTKRVRRIATWSAQQYRHACVMNRPTIVFVGFCDYLDSAEDLASLVERMEQIEDDLGLNVHRVFNFGPNVEDATDSLIRAAGWYAKRSW